MRSFACALLQILAVATIVVVADVNCRFATKYTTKSLMENATLRRQFLVDHATREAFFCKFLGLDQATSMTYDGHRLDIETGMPIRKPHMFSAPSKESLHVAVLARALEGHPIASAMYTPAEALEVMRLKVRSFEKFHERFPGFGGFFPWVAYDGNGSVTPAWNWNNQVPALDNGELFWAAYAAAHILEERFSNETALIKSWHQVWRNMTETALPIFYAGKGNLRTVTQIRNQSWPVSNNTYHGPSGYLNDPYEGELFTVMVYLFTNLSTQEKELLWINKRAMLQEARLVLPAHMPHRGNVTYIAVQRGFWFSAHEQWKYLMLPYRRSDVNNRVFMNGERARTWYAHMRRAPGLWASVNGPIPHNNASFPYYSDCGVPPIAFQNVTHDDVVTPYGAFPLFQASEPHGVAWFHHMLLARKGQNCFGTTESMNISGTDIAPLTTWDSKITTVVAALNGVVDIVERALRRSKLLDKFITIVDVEWTRVFGKGPLQGETLPFLGPLPHVAIPQELPDFTTCSIDSPPCPAPRPWK